MTVAERRLNDHERRLQAIEEKLGLNVGSAKPKELEEKQPEHPSPIENQTSDDSEDIPVTVEDWKREKEKTE